MKSKMLLTVTAALAVLAISCGNAEPALLPTSTPVSSTAPNEAPTTTSTSTLSASTFDPLTLSSGTLALPAATGFGEPGFHEVLTVSGTLPADLGDTSGLVLVLALSDAGRPAQGCNTDHPLSGCATVDWSDAPGRPNVPSDGIFVNSLQIEMESGFQTFFLTETGALRDINNRFDPG